MSPKLMAHTSTQKETSFEFNVPI